MFWVKVNKKMENQYEKRQVYKLSQKSLQKN